MTNETMAPFAAGAAVWAWTEGEWFYGYVDSCRRDAKGWMVWVSLDTSKGRGGYSEYLLPVAAVTAA